MTYRDTNMSCKIYLNGTYYLKVIGGIVMDINHIKKQLYNDIKKYNTAVTYYLAKDIADTMYEEAHSAIRYFYSQYHPHEYVRHWNFWATYKRIGTHYGSKKNTVGVELLLNEFPDEYRNSRSKRGVVDKDDKKEVFYYESFHRNDPQDVFWRVYKFGWHGIASLQPETGVPTMTPSPYVRLINKRDEIIKNKDDYIERAKEKAKKGNYNILY